MIINIPIEPIPMRYSCDWDKWFTEYWDTTGIEFVTVYGEELTQGIEQGRFLDCIGTNYYKSSQLMKLLKMLHEGNITANDTLFFHDLWFPGIEQLRYAMDAMQSHPKIKGCLHAGAYDPNDFLYEKYMGDWAVHFEHMLFQIIDTAFVATEFHKDLIHKARSVPCGKIENTGFPILFKQIPKKRKNNWIVFPHRRDPEKDYKLFQYLKKEHPIKDWEWISTESLINSKEEYYNILAKSKIAISLAHQETWGIAMQECIGAGCIPFMPNRLSYAEMYPENFLYNNQFELLTKIKEAIQEPEKYLNTAGIVKKGIEYWGKEALQNITEQL